MTSDKHQIMKRKLEMLDYEISQLKLTSHKSFVGSFLAKPHVKKPIKNNSKCGQLEKQNIKGRRLIMPDPYPPIELLCCQESEVHLDRKNNVTEDDGKPIIAEANEEDEKKIDEFHAQKKFKFEDNDLGKLETLEHGLRNAQMDLAWHKTLTDLLMEELIKTREQANVFKEQITNIKISSEKVIQDENKNWKIATDSLKVYYKMNNSKIAIKNWQENKRKFLHYMNY